MNAYKLDVACEPYLRSYDSDGDGLSVNARFPYIGKAGWCSMVIEVANAFCAGIQIPQFD